MIPLQAKKRLLVAEATIHRELLRAEFERLAGHADGLRRHAFSITTMVRSGIAVGKLAGLFRKRSGRSSKIGTLLGLIQTGWSLWNGWNSAVRPGPAGAQRPRASDQGLADAIEDLRRASKSTS